MTIKLSNPRHQFFIGLILNISFLILLYSCKVSYINTQIPAGAYEHNIWESSDVSSYVTPAVNFVQYGVFGNQLTPDHLRTVGYPALIALFYSVFGGHWVLALQIFQCILFAFLYPIVTLIAQKIIPAISASTIAVIFLFSLFSGVYFVRSAMILTDSIFLLFFTLGVLLGIKAFAEKKASYVIAYILCITVAGLIRPTLFLFPLLNIAISFFVARQNGFGLKNIAGSTIVTTLVFIVCCNLSSVRNYINYSFFSPSSVVGINAFDYAARKVLIGAGRYDEYQQDAAEIAAIKDVSLKTEMRKSIFMKSVKTYPLVMVKVAITNSINVFLDNHLINNVANYFGYNWKTYPNVSASFATTYSYKKSSFCLYATYALMVVYAFIWLLFVLFIYNCMVNRRYEYLVLIACLLVIFVLPGVITGDGGSRFRLPFEPFLMIFSFYQLSQMRIGQPVMRLMRNVG